MVGQAGRGRTTVVTAFVVRPTVVRATFQRSKALAADVTVALKFVASIKHGARSFPGSCVIIGGQH